MKNFLLVITVFSLSFSQVLEIDSIIDPGTWINPESVLVSDDLYGVPGGNNDHIIFGIADPGDTSAALDSVKVFLEQYVSDSTRAFWYVTPIINGNPSTSTPQQAGTETESVLSFDISADFTGWADVFALEIQLTPIKGAGAPPDWYADYLYVQAYSAGGIGEEQYGGINDFKLSMPTITRKVLTFAYNLNTASNVVIEIYNIAGEKVLAKEIPGIAGSNNITLNEIGMFSKGVYYLKIKSNDSIASGKFIVLD